jgi:N-acetylmuramoyl-L-alanine amidase
MMRFVVLVLAACTSSSPPTPPPSSPPAQLQADDAAVVVSVDAMPSIDAAPPVDAAPLVTIIDAPMKWSAEREKLTLEYRRQHSDAAATNLDIAPTVIVLHYTGGNSAKGTRGYFDNTKIEASRKELAKAGLVNVSSHYVIDRDGTIYRLQSETRFARHCIGLNHIAIGIENVGNEKEYPLTAARFPITHLLGHYEVMGMRKNKSPLYVELDPTYGNDKPDPGKAFMAKVRAEVVDLKLSGP